MNNARPPFLSISETTLEPLSGSMSTIETDAPSAANRHAEARPMPEAPPVISAVLPSSAPMAGSGGGEREGADGPYAHPSLGDVLRIQMVEGGLEQGSLDAEQ